MNRRIVIKTALICFGIFMIISAAVFWFLSDKYEIDTEKKYQVVAARVPISQGTVVTHEMLLYKTVRESSMNSHMVREMDEIAGSKAAEFIGGGDYIRNYSLIKKEDWFKDDERTIVLPMDVEERMANLVKKGSYIDIKLYSEVPGSIPGLILSKIRVEDVLDENGISLGDNGANRKAFAKLILDEDNRNRIYGARGKGKLIFELYCDETQIPAE